MNQLAIPLEEPLHCIQPKVGTQAYTLLHALYKGERLTVAKALNEYHCYALSQRMGDLKRLGWPIKSRRADDGDYKIYWIDFQ